MAGEGDIKKLIGPMLQPDTVKTDFAGPSRTDLFSLLSVIRLHDRFGIPVTLLAAFERGNRELSQKRALAPARLKGFNSLRNKPSGL